MKLPPKCSAAGSSREWIAVEKRGDELWLVNPVSGYALQLLQIIRRSALFRHKTSNFKAKASTDCMHGCKQRSHMILSSTPQPCHNEPKCCCCCCWLMDTKETYQGYLQWAKYLSEMLAGFYRFKGGVMLYFRLRNWVFLLPVMRATVSSTATHWAFHSHAQGYRAVPDFRPRNE